MCQIDNCYLVFAQLDNVDEQAAQIRRELDGRLQLAEKIAKVRHLHLSVISVLVGFLTVSYFESRCLEHLQIPVKRTRHGMAHFSFLKVARHISCRNRKCGQGVLKGPNLCGTG